jgi:hypothetical protein
VLCSELLRSAQRKQAVKSLTWLPAFFVCQAVKKQSGKAAVVESN